MRKVKKLIKLVENSDINELEERGGWWIFASGVKIKKSHSSKKNPSLEKRVPVQQNNSKNYEPIPNISTPEKIPSAEENYVRINAPAVGTFYYHKDKSLDFEVDVGSRVEAGKAFCYIGAIKLMTAIKPEVSGFVKQIFVKNAEPVEFGQPLFSIEVEKPNSNTADAGA